MTRAELEAKVMELETKLASASQTIAEFETLANRAMALESQVLDQQQVIATLETKLTGVKSPDAFTELAKGWLVSALGQRANHNSKIDLTGFSLGITERDFGLIQLSYKNILGDLAADGMPATTEEQQEIGVLLKTLGFV